MKKITPEISRFISDNNTLTSRALAALIDTTFNIKVSHVTIEPYLLKARAAAQADNNAKVEAVRSKILDDADKWANKYLKYLDEEVEQLKQIISTANDIEIETAKDRATISQAFQKSLSMVLDFVKPETDIKININQDLSRLSDQELKQLEIISAKLECNPGGESKAASP